MTNSNLRIKKDIFSPKSIFVLMISLILTIGSIILLSTIYGSILLTIFCIMFSIILFMLYFIPLNL